MQIFMRKTKNKQKPKTKIMSQLQNLIRIYCMMKKKKIGGSFVLFRNGPIQTLSHWESRIAHEESNTNIYISRDGKNASRCKTWHSCEILFIIMLLIPFLLTFWLVIFLSVCNFLEWHLLNGYRFNRSMFRQCHIWLFIFVIALAA